MHRGEVVAAHFARCLLQLAVPVRLWKPLFTLPGKRDIALCFLIAGTDPESEIRRIRCPDYRWVSLSRPVFSETVNYVPLLFSILDNYSRDYDGVLS